MYHPWTAPIICQYVAQVFPKVKQELKLWTKTAAAIPDPILREQALASIRHKTFHALGGSIFALYPGVAPDMAVKFIVALQTISDYLDNLCDRTGITDESAFRRLHLAMLDATDPEGELHDYYRDYPNRNDPDYLSSLVSTCRQQAVALPSYHLVQKYLVRYCTLYSDLQSLKHLDRSCRHNKLKKWATLHQIDYPGLSWFEFAAATGSTLGMFLMFAASADPFLTESMAGRLDEAYFPWIHALHILLDYFIDTEEDRRMGDLNFVHYYENQEVCRERLSYLINKSLSLAGDLPHPAIHRLVIHGLSAMYLSDPKAFIPQNRIVSGQLLRDGGFLPGFYHKSCLVLRAFTLLR